MATTSRAVGSAIGTATPAFPTATTIRSRNSKFDFGTSAILADLKVGQSAERDDKVEKLVTEKLVTGYGMDPFFETA